MTWYNHSYKGEIFSKYIVVVQSLSHVRLIATPWTAACQVSVLHPLPELTQTHVHWVGYAIQPSRPLLSPSLPASSLSQHQGLFQWVGSLHQVARVLELQPSTSVLPMNSGFISFRINCLDLLAIQGTLKSLLHHHSSKASILQCSAFFMVQLLNPH